MPIYNSHSQLLEAIYDGSNIAARHKRDQKKQELNFKQGQTQFSHDVNLLSEFKCEGDFLGGLGRGLLNHIIKTSNKPALDCVLKQEPNLANHYFPGENHPLYQAASLGSMEMIDTLLKYGANPNGLVHQAAKSSHERVIANFSGNTSHETVALAVAANKEIPDKIKKKIKEASIAADSRMSDNHAEHHDVLFRRDEHHHDKSHLKSPREHNKRRA